MTDENAADWRLTLTTLSRLVREDPDGMREGIDSLPAVELARLRTAAQVLEDEVERAEAVIDELDRVTAFDTRPVRFTMWGRGLGKRTQAIEEVIEHAVAEQMAKQAAALEQALPMAAARGLGVAVITAADGRWRVQFDPEMPPMTVAHRAVDVLPPLAGEERSTDAD